MTLRSVRVLLLAVAAIALWGCAEEQGPAERAGERLDDIADEARDRFEDARDEIEEAAEEVREALQGE